MELDFQLNAVKVHVFAATADASVATLMRVSGQKAREVLIAGVWLLSATTENSTLQSLLVHVVTDHVVDIPAETAASGDPMS